MFINKKHQNKKGVRIAVVLMLCVLVFSSFISLLETTPINADVPDFGADAVWDEYEKHGTFHGSKEGFNKQFMDAELKKYRALQKAEKEKAEKEKKEKAEKEKKEKEEKEKKEKEEKEKKEKNTKDTKEEKEKKEKEEKEKKEKEEKEKKEKEEDKDKPKCSVEGIGWIICPITNVLGKMMDAAYKFIGTHFLEVKSGTMGSEHLKSAWENFRNIANVLFVIAFLVIIYSQTTGAGISNYGIKKMLPRLIVVALLVNLSFYICQVAVDLSNILGQSVNSFFGDSNFAMSMEGGDTQSIAKREVGGPNAEKIAAGVLVVGTAAVATLAVMWLCLPILLLTLLSGLVAVLMVVLILLTRQVLIILLVVVSPMAFAAYLLPNTEALFDKWKKMFISLLILFPVTGLVFGGCRLAASIVGGADSDDKEDMIMRIATLFIAVVPLFLIVPLFKGALKATGEIGAKINGMGDKLQKKARENSGNTRIGQMGRSIQQNRSRKKAIRQTGMGRGPRSLANRFLNRVTGEHGRKAAAYGANAANEQEEKDIKQEEALLTAEHGGNRDAMAAALQEALASKNTNRAQAAANILANSGSGGVMLLHKAIEKSEEDGTMSNTMRDKMKSFVSKKNLKGKDAALDTWANNPNEDANGRPAPSLEEVTRDARTWEGLTPAELAGQTWSADDSGALNHAEAAGVIDQDMAKRVLENKDISGNLDNNKYKLFKGHL